MGGPRRRWLAWGCCAATLAAGGVGAAGATALQVGVTVPGVGSAEATVTTPTVTAPSLPPPPTVTAPSLPAPTVPVPAIPEPELQTPSATVTTDPGIAPAPADLAAPRLDPATSSASGDGGAATAGGEVGVGAGVAATGGEASAAPAPATGGSRADQGVRTSAGVPGATTRAATLAAGDSIAQTVGTLRQCLDELGTRERRVLSLRAGVGPGPPLSRAQVARRLDLGVAQTGRIERRGLRRLDRLAGTGACGDGSSAASAGLLASSAAGVTPDHLGDPAAVARPRFAVGGVVAHGGEDAGGRSGGLALPPPIGTGGEATLLVALGLLVALALLLRRELLRR